jgi:protein-tyrosine-phosphatase
MAEGIFNALVPDQSIVADSAGVAAMDGTPPSMAAVQEMKRRGIEIASLKARNISFINVSLYEMIIALDPEVAGIFTAMFPNFERLRIWNIPDPFGGSADGYQPTADSIRAQVEELIREIS